MSNSTKPHPSDQMPEAFSDAGAAVQRRHFEREALARLINTSREDAGEAARMRDLPTGNKNRIGEAA